MVIGISGYQSMNGRYISINRHRPQKSHICRSLPLTTARDIQIVYVLKFVM